MDIRTSDIYEIENNPHLIGIRLDEEQELWYNEIVEIMKYFNTDKFPTHFQFKQMGKLGLQNRISNYMGTQLFRDTYGL